MIIRQAKAREGGAADGADALGVGRALGIVEGLRVLDFALFFAFDAVGDLRVH